MTTKNKHLIDGVEPTNYARIPNMAIDDLPYAELALYAYYKRVAYDTGACWRSTATIAKSLKMSPKKLRATRNALEKRGLIVVTANITSKIECSPKTIRIVNIWQENKDRYNVTPVENDLPLGTKSITPGYVSTHKEKPLRKTNKEDTDSLAQNASGNGLHLFNCQLCQQSIQADTDWMVIDGTDYKLHKGCMDELQDMDRDSGHDDEQPILMAAVVATLKNIIAYADNTNHTLRHNPITWARCEKLGLVVKGSVTDKGFELIAQYDSTLVDIALEIRAANEATRDIRDNCPDCGNRMWHDGIEFVCDECCGKAVSTVDCADVLSCNGSGSVWCGACRKNKNADLAARPALPVAENDDRFLGTRDAPVTPNGADWTRDAVGNGNADDDIPDSSLCGYREPDGYMACHDCMGYGVCDSHAGARQVQDEPHTPPETPATSTGAIVPGLSAEQDTIVAKPVKPLKTGNGKKPPSEHTLMKNALVAAMGYTNDEITAWGDYNNASKKLRKAGATPEDMIGLHNHTIRAQLKGGWEFQSPMAMAKRWPEYQKQLRQQTKLVEVEQKPLDVDAGVIRGTE